MYMQACRPLLWHQLLETSCIFTCSRQDMIFHPLLIHHWDDELMLKLKRRLSSYQGKYWYVTKGMNCSMTFAADWEGRSCFESKWGWQWNSLQCYLYSLRSLMVYWRARSDPTDRSCNVSYIFTLSSTTTLRGRSTRRDWVHLYVLIPWNLIHRGFLAICSDPFGQGQDGMYLKQKLSC